MSDVKHTIAVRVESSRPLFIEADPDSFGEIFAHMTDEDQIEVLRAMVKHMKKWPAQWDHIGIALELEENREVLDVLKALVSS